MQSSLNAPRRTFLGAACLALALVVGAAQAIAEGRIALVVGNGDYDSVPALANPGNDAAIMAAALEDAGFDVTLLLDASQLELVRAISEFGRDLRSAGEDATGLFYYAGHGVQSFGTNYLLPVDVELQDAADLSLVGVDAEAVLRQMFSARNRTNIVIFDACRDNPFVRVPDMNDNGLAEMKAPPGTFLAYSTAPGEVAVDGTGANSPFTAALARNLVTPGEPIETLFRRVRVEVREATGGTQTPWDTSSLTTDFQFVPAVQLSPEEIQLRQLWESVKLSRDPIQLLLFLRSNPGTVYTEEARALLAELMAEELPGTAAPATPPVASAPAPTPVDPATAERDLIESARQSGLAADYEAYLATYPEGAFAELARLELATIAADGQRTDPISEEPSPEEVAALAAPAAGGADNASRSIRFDAPIGGDDPELAARSLSDLIAGSPRFPPIEGLPEALWKDQTCASCHAWTRDALCDQAQTYITRTDSLEKPHPYGGAFKRTLQAWAVGGCQ